MNTQSEAMLEESLIDRLVNSGYQRIVINNEDELYDNLKDQLEKHNNTKFTEEEFRKIKNHLMSSSVFESAKKLRDKFELDREDGVKYIDFFNKEKWCQNLFQVANQITMKGRRETRYDVTLLINGLPLVQIELKKRGVELKQAYNQINRYHRDSYKELFTYVQYFIISNGVDTKYFANNGGLRKDDSYSNTFNWTDENNNKINDLQQFTDIFLEKCHISKMIAKYTVLHESTKKVLVLRPYQYFAVEKIVDLVEHQPHQNGYIWHTTGSGKTLTSFKASQILTTYDKIDKVIFVVDRKDLDYQTIKEFKAFSKDSVEDTKNTGTLEKQLTDNTVKLIITTIQKLNNLISKERYRKNIMDTQDKRIVFIFDECHRSQFGDIHKKIDKFFHNKQFIGFTGTPIFKDNSINKQTTEDLFGKRLHAYVIKDAINDENVLGFSVDYVQTISNNEKSNMDIDDFLKIKGIDKQEVFESEERLNNIVDYIVKYHNKKTYSKAFTSIFAVQNIKNAIKYYELFKSKNTDLKIATIFTYDPNEKAIYTSDVETDEDDLVYNKSSRDKLDEIVKDFNKTFGTNHDLDKNNGFNAYFVDISKKVKEQKVDILIVVNMFLTGFDSKPLNTLYVDKNLRYHGLIQAYSRTNRIYGEKKMHGNIVCFRNLKNRTDEAITLFSNEDAITTVIKESYDYYQKKINDLIQNLLRMTPTVQSVDQLQGDREEVFIRLFRDILHELNIIETFSEFEYKDIDITEQMMEDFKSKYKDIYEKYKRKKEADGKESIIDQISFDLELIRKDHINVQYILELLANLEYESPSFEADKKYIMKLIDSSENLYSKKELVLQFIEENIVEGNDISDFESNFYDFMEIQKEKEIKEYAEKENLSADRIALLLQHYEFSNRIENDRLKELSNVSLKLLERRKRSQEWRSFIEETSAKYSW